MKLYEQDKKILFPGIKLGIVSLIILVTSLISVIASGNIDRIDFGIKSANIGISWVVLIIQTVGIMAMITSFTLALSSILIFCHHLSNKEKMIEFLVRRALFDYRFGNPLHLKNGEILPRITCNKYSNDKYRLSISTLPQMTVDDIDKLPQCIGASLDGEYSNYAVVAGEGDTAMNYVNFYLEDVLEDKTIHAYSVNDLKPKSTSKLMLQLGDFLDLEFAGSILCAGKTRSGKTTAIMTLLMQVLLLGRDRDNSSVVIIDPKQAELSRLPHVKTLDEDGSARTILSSIEEFAETVKNRQKRLNDLSEMFGGAVKWFEPEADMKPSYLFIDEYVALYDLFPKKASKDDPWYCVQTFEKLIRRITTMGASAGCFVIISIAEASVGSGNISTLLKSAMTTKLLFKPTRVEAQFLWDSDKLETLPNRPYSAGECFFSSTDGVHDLPKYIHFPELHFAAYKELGRLLKAYYNE